MVSQGVKNPLIDLTALEDKTLDEVSTWQKYKKKIVSVQGKGDLPPVEISTNACSKTGHLLGCCAC